METVIEDRGSIPGWVKNHASFRRWTRSPEFPKSGQYGWLGDRLWVDLSMERDSHNQLKTEATVIIGGLAKRSKIGKYWGDRMLLTYPSAGLSTEPDGMFASWETIRAGRVRIVGGHPADGIEVMGTPDMVLEVVSRSSVRKDLKFLPKLYWTAGIREYWLIDARGLELQFNILRHGASGYRKAPVQDGWRKSLVFGAAFRLTQTADPLGEPAYALEMK
jgi:Uma2 family endonuclease